MAAALPWVGPAADAWPLAAGAALAGGWCARRCARPSRSPASCWRAPGATRSSPTSRPPGRSRQALEVRTTSLSTCSTSGLHLRADLLRPWAHWITPENEPRRFDTRFFVAALPAGQATRDVGGEADAGCLDTTPAMPWPELARGERVMVPPTAMTLADLTDFGTVADVLAAAGARRITPVMPRLRRRDGGCPRSTLATVRPDTTHDRPEKR